MTVRVVDDRVIAERAVAREIADLVRAKATAVLGLATGSSVSGVYRELGVIVAREAIDFSRVVTFNLDEYLDLAPDHPCSFRSWMRAHCFVPLGLDPARAHVPKSALSTDAAEAHAREYERAIAAAGGIDYQILGLGRNGHIGFNEPGSSADSRTRVVELHPWTIADAASVFRSIDRVPRRAITVGVATILAARRIRVLAFGERKRDVVRGMLRNEPGPELPATYLRAHSEVVVWLDRAAAADLDAAL